jgi:hypothetical protein
MLSSSDRGPQKSILRRYEDLIDLEDWSYRVSSLMTRALQCNIDELAKWHPWFFLEPRIVACTAVLDPYGRPTAGFDVDCFNVESSWLGDAARFRLEVSWSSDTADKEVAVAVGMT